MSFLGSNFFHYQGELLSSVNFIISPSFFSRSAVTIIGLLVSLLTLGFFFLKRKQSISQPPFYYFIIFMLVGWVPLGLQFFYNTGVEISNLTQYRGSMLERLQSRYCAIDEAQRFNTTFCNLPRFIQKIYQTIPADSTVFIVDGPFRPFLEYQLTDSYYITDQVGSADYLLVYLPYYPLYQQEKIIYQAKGDRPDPKVDHQLGSFTIIDSFQNRGFILKRW